METTESESNKKRKRSASVTSKTQSQQAEEIHDQWWWVEPRIWTTRMLTRLATSGSETKWFRLWDKVCAERTLESAFWAVWRNKGSSGVDGQGVGSFYIHRESQLARLEKELREGTYKPLPVKRVWIPKPGSKEKRPLGIPSVRDRVTQSALRKVIEPIFEADFAEQSYGFRPGRGCQQAVGRVEELLNQGYHWVVDLDLKSYFDTIPHNQLMDLVKVRIADGPVLRLIESYLKAGVMETMKQWRRSEKGAPQGAVISPLLSNLYLNPLDHMMVEQGWEMVRYADDAIVLCRTQEEAQKALNFIKKWTEKVELILHPEKTHISDVRTSTFDFLGWTLSLHKGRSRKWPRKKSVKKLRETLKPLTRRTRGKSLKATIARINPILKGWYGYFKEAHASRLEDQDRWIRRRLRAMLRKHRKQPGFGHCLNDHKRWPNRWFAEQGLFSLVNGSCTYG